MDSITELARRGAVVLVLAGVFLQGLLGLLPAEKAHTPRYRRPWGLQAQTIHRIGQRVIAVRLQVVAVAL